MKLFRINRTEEPIYLETIYEDISYSLIIIEAQEDFLANKYPEVDKQLILKAIEFDRRNAEKLVLGLKQGVINDINKDSLAAVVNLDPYAKNVNKSATELAYDEAIKEAKRINLRYWVWILRVKKNDPDARFDESIFHYLEEHDLDAEDIKDQSLEEINLKSQQWHNEQFAEQEVGGTYKLGPESDEILLKIGAFTWVPVYSEDALIEGAKMQNCIGGFCKPSDKVKIFSLRNKFNNPHVSMSIKFDQTEKYWYFSEIKGKQNRQPIPKYIPFILPAVDELIRKGVKIDGGDLVNLPEFSPTKYIMHMTGDVLANSTILNSLDDDMLKDFIKTNGITNNAIVNSSRLESIMNRIDTETALSVFSNPKQQSGFKYVDWLMAAISARKITEEQANELITKYDLRRSAQMVLLSAYRSDEFMEQLKKVHIEDLAAAIGNYLDAIQVYPVKDEYFATILKQYLSAKQYVQYTMDNQILSALLSKIPANDLTKSLSQHEYGSGVDIVRLLALKNLIPYIINLDTESKVRFLSRLPQTIDVKNGGTEITNQISALVYSIPFENLRDVYALGIDMLNNKIKPVLIAAGQIAAEANYYKKISGTSPKMMADADLVLHTNDEDELRKIRKTTKSRGVKILVDRKLARLQRLQNVQ